MSPPGKYKGRKRHAQRAGLGRIRRASAKDDTRLGNLADHIDDDDYLERHAVDNRSSHTGEDLQTKFTKLKRDDANTRQGTICGFDGTRVLVREEDGTEMACEVRTALKKSLSGVKNPLCIGDQVGFTVPDNTAPVITSLLPRRNQIARADSHNRALHHVLAANVDHVVIVTAMAEPAIRPALIDRYLLLAHFDDIEPIIVFNKSDLDDPQPWHELYHRLDYPVFRCVCEGDKQTLDGLPEALAGKTCVVVGQSGVGKSSLIRALAPELDIRIGHISAVQQKGRHTTTASRSYVLDRGIVIMDTPGIRECGIPAIDPLDVALLYRDIAHFHHDCRFPTCTHSHEPDCAVKAAVERGEIAASRYESYRSILADDLA